MDKTIKCRCNCSDNKANCKNIFKFMKKQNHKFIPIKNIDKLLYFQISEIVFKYEYIMYYYNLYKPESIHNFFSNFISIDDMNILILIYDNCKCCKNHKINIE